MMFLIVILLFILIGVISSNVFREKVDDFYSFFHYFGVAGYALIGIGILAIIIVLGMFLFGKGYNGLHSISSLTYHQPYYPPYTSKDVLEQFKGILFLLIPCILYLAVKPFQRFVDNILNKFKNGKSVPTGMGAFLILGLVIILCIISMVIVRG